MNKLLKTAFTLIELLVVIAIIGILSGLIVVSMSGVTSKANIAKAQVFSNSLRNSLMANIVAEYKLDGNSNDSWGSSNGSFSGAGPTWKASTDCVYGQCLEFNGNNSNFIDLSNPTILNIDSNFTIGAWIKSSTMISAAGGIVSWGEQAVGKRRSLIVCNGGSGVKYYAWFSGFTAPANLSGTSNVVDGLWHYLTVTLSSSNVASVYVDGALQNSNSVTLASYSYSGVNIGRTQYLEYFNGLIDEVRLYNAAISTSQIKEQYYIGLNKLLINKSISNEEYQNKIAKLATEL
ncbi:MAG: LamG-like jellyroll fold domain-containing protein [Candidatus Paceibacterota bacterium]